MDPASTAPNYSIDQYWAKRSDMLYYRYVDYIIRTVGADARTMIDVGTGGCPYLDWFDWIDHRVSLDLAEPYASNDVQGIIGDVFNYPFDQTFDLLTCLQVAEHVPEPAPFIKRLLELASICVISVPFMWPEGATTNHVNDPVSLEDITDWAGRSPNYSIVVDEPFAPRTANRKGRRLITVFDRDPTRRFNSRDKADRLVRSFEGTITSRANTT